LAGTRGGSAATGKSTAMLAGGVTEAGGSGRFGAGGFASAVRFWRDAIGPIAEPGPWSPATSWLPLPKSKPEKAELELGRARGAGGCASHAAEADELDAAGGPLRSQYATSARTGIAPRHKRRIRTSASIPLGCKQLPGQPRSGGWRGCTTARCGRRGPARARKRAACIGRRPAPSRAPDSSAIVSDPDAPAPPTNQQQHWQPVRRHPANGAGVTDCHHTSPHYSPTQDGVPLPRSDADAVPDGVAAPGGRHAVC
jgi:hypothetical protein